MSDTIKIKGQEFPVSAPFSKTVLEVHKDLVERDRNPLEVERDNLLRISGDRHKYVSPMPEDRHAKHRSLSPEEGDRLEALTHAINLHQMAAILQGRDHKAAGFATLDAVHSNSGAALCGCSLEVLFDHNRAQASAWARDVVKHEQILQLLEADPAAPAFAVTLIKTQLERHRTGFAHFAAAASLGDMAAAEAAKLEVVHVPHAGLYYCDHHKHLAAGDPAAHHAAVKKDLEGVAEAINKAAETLAKQYKK